MNKFEDGAVVTPEVLFESGLVRLKRWNQSALEMDHLIKSNC